MKLAQRTGSVSRFPLITTALLASLALGGALGGCDDEETEPDGGVGGEGAGSVVEKATVPAPGGARRLTSTQLRYSVEYLLGSNAATLVDVWDDPQLHGFESIAAAELALGANEVSLFETVVTQVVDQSLLDRSHLAKFAPCVSQAPSAACYDEVATKFARVAWRRPVEADEKDRLVAIANQANAWGVAWGFDPFTSGLKYELMAILQSPSFIYISEVGTKDGDYRRLSGSELATRMSFFLLHQTPDVTLLDAAEKGDLSTDDGIRTQARRLLALPEARRSVDRFYSELFLIRDLSNISKDPALFPLWNGSVAKSMQEEMLRFIQDVVWTRNADARELFTSPSTFVDANLAPIYGVPAPAGNGWANVNLPPEHARTGILGKAGFLARFAHPGLTSPTRRGRFFWEKLMCSDVEPPPAGVDTSIKPDPPTGHITMKQKLASHYLDDSCKNCHQRMDYVGLAMEHMDSIGKYRADDQGLPIETSFSYGNMSFASITDLGSSLANDPLATQCIVTNFWRQSMGHMETDGETAALEAIHTKFAESGFRVQDMLVEMAVSPAFQLVAEPK